MQASDTKSTVKPETLSDKNYAFLQQYIYSKSGIVVEADKRYLLESRLLPILREQRVESLDVLSTLLSTRAPGELSRLVIDAITTNETLFFRDSVMFESLKAHILPLLFNRVRSKRRVRIWSAASSSGQEAYSIAMMLLEMGESGASVELIGTDISYQVLERAREAKYLQFEVGRGLPTSYLLKYFNRSGIDWQLKEDVRHMVHFEHADLRQDLKYLGCFDLIFCRNVLIYFDAATKQRVLEQIRAMLNPEAGALVLGCAETTINIHDGFKRKVFGNTTVYTL